MFFGKIPIGNISDGCIKCKYRIPSNFLVNPSDVISLVGQSVFPAKETNFREKRPPFGGRFSLNDGVFLLATGRTFKENH